MPEPVTIRATWHEAVTGRWLRGPGPRTGIHEGGTRSGKTYNLCIAWVAYLLETPGELLSIVRGTGPALKATVRRDMIEVLRAFGVYSLDAHNRTDDIITLPSGSQIEFFATDDQQKVHGRKRTHLWENEANELDADTHTQLVVRTEGRVLLDFNPSMREDHWIWARYDDAPPDGDRGVVRWRSTYLDNPFLTAAQIAEIEALREQDEWAWQVYGLGRRGVPADAIFRDVEPLPSWDPAMPYVYGVDFGYNDPTVLQRVGRRDREGRPDLDVWALLHQSYLTNADFIDCLDSIGVDKRVPMWCDGAEPARIEEIRRAGYNARAADKGPGSVRDGIDFLKRHRIRVGADDPALAARVRAEWTGYRWRTVRGVVQDTPNHDGSHSPDAGRYAAFSEWGRPTRDYSKIL